jgi:hypothetical protein
MVGHELKKHDERGNPLGRHFDGEDSFDVL